MAWLSGAEERGTTEIRKRSPRFLNNRSDEMKTTLAEVSKQPHLRDRIYSHLKSHPGQHRIEHIASMLGANVSSVTFAIGGLEREGKIIECEDGVIELHRDLPSISIEVVHVKKPMHFIWGVTGDNHIASKYERLDVLEALFDIWKSKGVTRVMQLGNIIDGDCRFNKFDLHCHGVEAQSRYLAKHWPRRKGIVTEFITGDDHEGWYTQREGVNVGKIIQSRAEEAGRNDLKYVGHMERQIVFKNGKGKSIVSMIHAGGGTAYAISYTTQKIVESYQGGEKPAMLLVGHYHKFDYGFPREVHAIQCGCTEDQTPFMRKKKIQAMVGGVTLEFDVLPGAIINNVKVQWHHFYDREFERGTLWRYRD
jgi:hypothetical protein